MKILNLSGNNLNDESILTISKLLKHTSLIEKVSLGGSNINRNSFTDNSIGYLASILSELSFLKHIDLSYGFITSIGANHLFNALKNCNSLETIDLSQNSLNDSCIESLGNLIKDSKCISRVNLKNHLTKEPRNYITDDGMKLLSTYLFQNKSLKALDVSLNRVVSDSSISLIVDLLDKTQIQDVVNEGSALLPFEFINKAWIQSMKSGIISCIDINQRFVLLPRLLFFC